MKEKSKLILTSLLEQLKDNRDNINAIEDEKERIEIYEYIFDNSHQQDDHYLVTNLKSIYDHFVKTKKIPVDGFIGEITFLLDYYRDVDANVAKRDNEDRFDEKFGTTTRLHFQQFELEEYISVERWTRCHRYEPSPLDVVLEVLEALPTYDVKYDEFIFIDVGSGLGKTLLIASEYPFKEIIGLEISRFMNDITISNIQNYNSGTQQCKAIRSECIDALDFVFPNSDMILYFWEPLPADVGELFIKNLITLVNRNSTRCILVFLRRVIPLVEQSSFFKRIDTIRSENTSMGEGYFTLSVFSTQNQS